MSEPQPTRVLVVGGVGVDSSPLADAGLFISAGNLDCPSKAYGAYHEVVAPPDGREKQWQEITRAQADQRTAAVYRSESDFIAHRAFHLKKHKLKRFHYQLRLPFENTPSK